MFFPFTYKRKSFEHEREVRALFTALPPPIDGEIKIGTKNNRTVIQIDIDVNMLIKCVHISPTSPDWFHSLVANIVNKFGFMFEVKKSNLDSEPVF